MLLYLMRHAHAVSEKENVARPLSARGQAQVVQMGAFLRECPAFRPCQLWHSPLVRSRETAERLEAVLAREVIRVETPGLLPMDDPTEMARRVEAHAPEIPVVLVGHEPHLGALTGLLLRGRESASGVGFKKGAVLALESDREPRRKSSFLRWRVRWFVTPEMLPLPFHL